MKKALIRLFKSLAGYRLTYPLFQNLYYVSVIGMNYGNGGNPDKSGEIAVLRYIRKKLNGKKATLVDGGANFGKYTNLLLAEFAEATVYSFEPSAAYFQELGKQVDPTRAHLINLGLGERNEQLTLYRFENRPGLASVFDRNLEHYAIKKADEEQISLVRLDDFCDQHAIKEIDFLKLDIEGNELFALRGAGRLIEERKIRFIQFEFGGSNIDSKTYFRDFWHLLSKNYRIYRVLKNGLGEVKHYNEFQELFANMNHLAERRA